MQIQTTPFMVELLLENYQAAGTFDVRGNPAVYLNDQSMHTITLRDASLTPLMSGASVGEVSTPTLFVPKADVQIVLVGDYSRAEAQLLPRVIPLVCFTDTYAIRATFHAGLETLPVDVFYEPLGDFLPATDVEIYSLRPLVHPVSGSTDLVFIHKKAIRSFHQQ